MKITEYMSLVADYIDDEYGGNRSSSLRNLTNDERYTIKHMLHMSYENFNSINNTANNIMKYLSDNKAWQSDNQIK